MNHFSLSDVSAGTGCSARQHLTATPVSAYLTSPGFPYVYPRYIIFSNNSLQNVWWMLYWTSLKCRPLIHNFVFFGPLGSWIVFSLYLKKELRSCARGLSGVLNFITFDTHLNKTEAAASIYIVSFMMTFPFSKFILATL